MSRTQLVLTDKLSDYIRSVSLREPGVLRQLREETASHPHARMQISAEQGQFLQLLLRMLGARRVLEVGVFTGYSSTSMALALPDDGTLVACDVSEEYTSHARSYWKAAGVEQKVTLHLAPALHTLDALIADGKSGTFDLAFIDADKENYANYYERSLTLVRPAGLIVVDNTLWSGKVADRSVKDKDTVAIRAFNEKLLHDERIWLSLIPVGDGLTLACKRP